MYGNVVAKPEYEPKKNRSSVKRRKKVSRQVQKNRNRALHMNAAYVVFLAIAATIVLLLCVNYVRLQEELADLKEENTTKYNAVVDSVNLDVIREKAINQLGMTYATPDQIMEYDNPASDYVKQYENIPENGVLAQSDKIMARKKTNFFKKKISGLMQKKLVMLFGAIILAFVFLIGWITYINASKGEKYTKVVLDQQQYNNRTIPFKRGDIVDRNGTKLATSERVYNVVVDAKTITSNKKYINPTIKALSKCFDLKKKDVRKQIKKNPNSRYLVLKKGVNYEAYQKFEKITSDTDKNPNVQGVWMEEDYTRKYRYKTLASDVIGFTTNGNVGSNGIEASYNSILNGTDGREYGYLDEDSGYERTVKEPDNGSTVVSTIDLQVQSIVEQHILEFNEEHKNEATQGEGSKNTGVIVMNPQNGEILAEASYPNYDLNNPRDLTKYYTEEQLKKMTD